MSNILFHLHCPNCGKGIDDADTVCPHCGLNLDAPLEKTELQALAQPYLEKAQKALESGQNLKGALSNCDKAIEYTPESAEAHNLRGLVLDAMGKPDKAALAYREAIRLDPGFADAKDNLASLEAEYPDVANFAKRQQAAQNKKVVTGLAVVGVGIGLFMLAGLAIILYLLGRPFLTPKQTVIFEPDRSKVATVTPDDLKKTVEILKQRWAALGYGDGWVSFTVSDQGQIIGQIPADVSDELIQRTKAYGLVEFVDFGSTAFPEGAHVNTDFNSDYYPPATGQKWHTIMTNGEIKGAVTHKAQQGESYEIAFTLTANGTKILADFSSKNVGHYLGIVVDKAVIACPKIDSPIRQGNGVINGNIHPRSSPEFGVHFKVSAIAGAAQVMKPSQDISR